MSPWLPWVTILHAPFAVFCSYTACFQTTLLLVSAALPCKQVAYTLEQLHIPALQIYALVHKADLQKNIPGRLFLFLACFLSFLFSFFVAPREDELQFPAERRRTQQGYKCTRESPEVWFKNLLKKLECKLPRIARRIPLTLTREPETLLVLSTFFKIILIYFPSNFHPSRHL